MKLTRVTEPVDIEVVSALAREIWNQHFVPIIGQDQVDYMLDRFQSPQAIASQISSGYMYYMIEQDDQPVGYFSLAPVPGEKEEMQLSKIYVTEQSRGRGLGKATLGLAEELCAKSGVRKLWLTVNRHNSEAIDFYMHMGFTIEAEVVQDIGGGFVMDDYRMAKTITASP